VLELFHPRSVNTTKYDPASDECRRFDMRRFGGEMKKYGIGITLLVIGLLAASFFLMSYHATSSQTTQNSQVASTSGSGIENQNKLAAQLVTNVVVTGSSRLETSLKADLASLLPELAGLGGVNFVDSSNIPANAPLLYVQVKEQNVRWTPVYSTAALQVVVSYAENGDVSFKDQEPTHFQAGSFQFKGTYNLEDVSWGLMSLPGYQDYLAQNAAHTVSDGVQSQFKQ
jgi:hypothetical protein